MEVGRVKMEVGKSYEIFGQLNPPSVPAFLLVVPPHKKSSTQVGLREIQRKNLVRVSNPDKVENNKRKYSVGVISV